MKVVSYPVHIESEGGVCYSKHLSIPPFYFLIFLKDNKVMVAAN